MNKKTNSLIVFAVIAMLLLALISTGLSAYQSLGMARGFNPGSGQFPEGMPDQRNFPSDGNTTTPPNFEGNPPDGSGQAMPFGGEGNRQQGGGNGFPGGRQGGMAFGILRYVGLGLSALGLVLAVVLAIFLLKGKKWAGILALVWAGFMLVVNAFGLFTSRMLLTTVARIVCMLLAVAIFVLLLLKKSRAFWAASKQSEQDDDDEDDEDEDEIAAPQILSKNQTPTVDAGVQQPPQGDNDDDEDGD